MKVNFLLVAMALLLCVGCSKDNNNNGLIVNDGLIHYDGDNFSGPNLDPGTYEAAMMIPASSAETFKDKKLKEVRFFLAFFPVKCEVKVYTRGTDDSPGNLIYSADVTNLVKETTWFTHRLSDDLVLDGNDLWVSLAVEHTDTRQSISCDQGPHRTNGDWFYSSEDGQWRPYNERTPESVNWNIRVKVE